MCLFLADQYEESTSDTETGNNEGEITRKTRIHFTTWRGNMVLSKTYVKLRFCVKEKLRKTDRRLE